MRGRMLPAMSDNESEDDLVDPFAEMNGLLLDGPCRARLPIDANNVWQAALASQLGTNQIEHAVEEALQPWDSWAEWGGDVRRIHTPPVGSELGYLVAFHEIGHVELQLPSHDPEPDVPGAKRLFMNEAEVWIWAIDRAPFPPSEDAEAKILVLLYCDDPGEGLAVARARVREACSARRIAAKG